ncbi:MAG: SpoIVB peptidase [Clostridia bacterium]|nr:SpoIVB peptidase [Clostridia bacterium]
MTQRKIIFNKCLTVILAVIFSVALPLNVFAADDLSALTNASEVYVGGFPFGIKLFTEGLLVVGVADVKCEKGSVCPATDAGIKPGDVITKVNGNKVTTCEEFISVYDTDGKTLSVEFLRNGKTATAEINPEKSSIDGKYKTGMWLRDSAAGIGTVTFVECETGEFAGLGHGVCDSATGEVIPLMRGIVTEVKLTGVKPGVSGTPGELKGYFTKNELGTVLKNTDKGVFGIYGEIPVSGTSSEKVKLAKRGEVHEGKATIISTICDGVTEEYEIMIEKLPDGKEKVSFEIRVTDSKLIEKTGGIVQGMSGSPILQDGKLVGAVTHVMISDPTRGYGIFIEDMIKAAE